MVEGGQSPHTTHIEALAPTGKIESSKPSAPTPKISNLAVPFNAAQPGRRHTGHRPALRSARRGRARSNGGRDGLCVKLDAGRREAAWVQRFRDLAVSLSSRGRRRRASIRTAFVTSSGGTAML